MERHLDDELKQLNTDLLKMATLTEESIHKSVEALKTEDKHLAQSVIEDDKKIDELENQVEEKAIELLALFQPMAKDLRFITTGMKINTELERIADMAVNISQRVKDIADDKKLKTVKGLPDLSENSKSMVRNSIDAFIKRDKELARQVILSDKRSNELRNKIMTELVNERMMKDPKSTPAAVSLLLIARDLERISDHAASIAEDVIYMIEARVVKHHLEELIYVYKKVNDN